MALAARPAEFGVRIWEVFVPDRFYRGRRATR